MESGDLLQPHKVLHKQTSGSATMKGRLQPCHTTWKVCATTADTPLSWAPISCCSWLPHARGMLPDRRIDGMDTSPS